MGILKLDGVSKSFGEGAQKTDVLKNIDLDVQEGEFLVLLGFSGTGKTTLINLMAGLEQPTKGSVTFKGAPITGPGPERGVIFQSYSLMPWLTVNGNVRLAVDTVFPKMPAEEKQAKVDHYVKMVGLSHATTRRPAELSGGMRQRVNVARALAMKPEVLLLDEPLSALDAVTQKHTAQLITDLQAEEGFAALIVTHDFGYAVAHADDIAVLKGGRIVEMADVETFARDPKTEYCRTLRDAAIALGGLEATL